MELPSATPASPAILPSGTVNDTVEGQEAVCGRTAIGSTPWPSTSSLRSSGRKLEATSMAASNVIG
jgi:hypothetical protein